MTEEVARRGNKELAKFLGVKSVNSIRPLIKRMKAFGVIFEWPVGVGPGKKVMMNCWFPSRVMAFMGLAQIETNKKDAPESAKE